MKTDKYREIHARPDDDGPLRVQMETELTGAEVPIVITDSRRNKNEAFKSEREGFIREKWDNKAEFILAIIGYSVDLGNIWRFPYVCYRSGGGAFLIPYLVMFIFGALPLCYLELALGQYHRNGCISVWKKICPLFKGVGFAICLVLIYLALFYNTIISWAVYYFFASFNNDLPWKYCNNTWNTQDCSGPVNFKTERQSFEVLPADEYFRRNMLQIHRSMGFEKMGPLQFRLMLCSALAFTIVFFALCKGPKSYGKAVWITTTMPYIVLLILLVRALTLPGAPEGIQYYLTPTWKLLLNYNVWYDAAIQIFFSLGPGSGVLLALSSYNQFNNNCYRDAVVTGVVNCLTSLIAGFVVFSMIGYLSAVMGKDLDFIASEGGPGLIFIVIPQAIAILSWGPFFSVIFFLMLIMVGINNTFGTLEAVITAFQDEFPAVIGKHRKLFVLCLVVFCYVGSLATMTRGGNYLIHFLDAYGVSGSILLIITTEIIAVCWCYGVKNLSNDVKEMLGFKPGWFWQVCWMVISPGFMIAMVIAQIWLTHGWFRPLEYFNYIYPEWSVLVGWTIRLSSLICIPTYMVYKLLFLRGSFREVCIKKECTAHL